MRYLLLLLCFVSCGDSVDRFLFLDQGDCQDTILGNYVERWDETVECMEDVLGYSLNNPTYIPPTFILLDDEDLVQDEVFGQECTWFKCDFNFTGLCKGAYGQNDSKTEFHIFLPITDDTAYEHEVVHHVYGVEKCEPGSHVFLGFPLCGLRR